MAGEVGKRKHRVLAQFDRTAVCCLQQDPGIYTGYKLIVIT